jgi:hypothetical protein
MALSLQVGAPLPPVTHISADRLGATTPLAPALFRPRGGLGAGESLAKTATWAFASLFCNETGHDGRTAARGEAPHRRGQREVLDVPPTVSGPPLA